MINKRFRFMFSLIAILLVGFVSTSFISYFVAHNSVASQIQETALPLTSDNIYSEIQRDLLRPIFISSLMANDTFVRDWTLGGEHDEDAIIHYLKEIQQQYGTVTCFFVSDISRKYYHPTGMLKVVSESDPQDKWFFRARMMKNDYEINVDTDTADSSMLDIFINYKVRDYSGNLIGITGVGLSMKSVQSMIDNYEKRYGRRIYFADKEGNISLSCQGQGLPGNIRNIPGLEDQATGILTSPGYSGSYHSDGAVIRFNSRYVPEFNWYLVVEQVEAPEERLIEKTLLVNLAISLIITAIVFFVANLTYGKYQRRLEEMASTDSLTGTASRMVFDMMIEQSIKSSLRRKEAFSLILFDLDNFKEINDNYGHPAGDKALKEFSERVRSEIRDSDILCRWGGDEFVLLLHQCQNSQASELAEKIRRKVESESVLHKGKSMEITVSLGITEFRPGDDPVSLFKRADRALYTAKEKGRNRVEVI